jgi:hypothetical protein
MAGKPGSSVKRQRWEMVWTSHYLCSSRGCGAQVHTLFVQGANRPAADKMLTYTCPVPQKLTGFRFGDLEWRTVPACPAGSVAARGKWSA